MSDRDNITEQAIFLRPGVVVLAKKPLRQLQAGEVLVQGRCSLVSNGTEKIAFQGQFSEVSHWAEWVRYPFSPGYAMIGTIVGVFDRHAHSLLGRRVAVRGHHASLQIQLLVHCILVPEELSDVSASWFALARIAFLGVTGARLRPSSSVLVVGGGPIGQMAVRWLQLLGVERISILAAYDSQLHHARIGGAVCMVKGNTRLIMPELLTNFVAIRPDTVFDCTGDASVLVWATAAVEDNGSVILIGDPARPEHRTLDANVMLKGLTVRGVHDRNVRVDWTPAHIAQLFFTNLRKGAITIPASMTHSYSSAEAARVYDELATKRGLTGLAFIWHAPDIAADQT